MKHTQSLMIWFFPLILIGGIVYPLLGYLVVGFMVFLLGLSFFRGRYWCSHLCPRGAFLDLILSKVSAKRSIPRMLSFSWFRWLVFICFIGVLGIRIILIEKTWVNIGGVFVVMCWVSSIIAIILGIVTKHRAWCVICPMGMLQEKIAKGGANREPTRT